MPRLSLEQIVLGTAAALAIPGVLLIVLVGSDSSVPLPWSRPGEVVIQSDGIAVAEPHALSRRGDTVLEVAAGHLLRDPPWLSGRLAGYAIAVPMKRCLSRPNEESSIDSQLRKLNPTCMEHVSEAVIRGCEEREVWATRLDGCLVSGERQVFAIAGIEADNRESVEVERVKQNVAKGVAEAVRIAAADGQEGLLLPLVGNGNAGLGRADAMEAVFRGVEDSISSGRAPRKIVLVLYAKGGSAENEIRALVGDASRLWSDDPNGFIRPGRRRAHAVGQVSVFLAIYFFLVYVVLRKERGNVRMSPGSVVLGAVKYTALQFGLVSFSGAEGFRLTPVEPSVFGVICVMMVLLPLIEWYAPTPVKIGR